jgi:hypothetical protein
VKELLDQGADPRARRVVSTTLKPVYTSSRTGSNPARGMFMCPCSLFYEHMACLSAAAPTEDKKREEELLYHSVDEKIILEWILGKWGGEV